ncbi:hypothetical protein [Nitrospirillum bahiense]|uniref:Uncharacterized protein n=1 Tax=Nitrospirillum amazonense TaxID=28077 RepID=A0A560F1U1_9PROT|nr:hypothetical protein [Nitrospirillum amazonense]TWB15588.1 hypothetical protein FBZ88_12941 [Nitrospirillum amazonense]
MIRASDMIDAYRGGRLLYCWTLVDGHPRCVCAPLDVAGATHADLARHLALNAAARALATAAEAYEAAAFLSGAPCPTATLPIGQDGDPVPNPAYAAWANAGALVAGASQELLSLVATRAGTLPVDGLGAPVGAFVFDPPDPPAFAPGTETADWDGTAWTVRPVTADEASAWAALMAVKYPRRMSASDLVVRLLTPAEWMAIVADAHPTAGGPALGNLLVGAGTQYVDLDSARTAGQLQDWVDRGLITADRMAWILTGMPPAA